MDILSLDQPTLNQRIIKPETRLQRLKADIEQAKRDLNVIQNGRSVIASHLKCRIFALENEMTLSKENHSMKARALEQQLGRLEFDREERLKDLLKLRIRRQKEDEMKLEMEATKRRINQEEELKYKREKCACKIQVLFRRIYERKCRLKSKEEEVSKRRLKGKKKKPKGGSRKISKY